MAEPADVETLTDAIRIVREWPDRASTTARNWAIAAGGATGWPIAEPLKPMLVKTIDELYDHPSFGLSKSKAGLVELGPWRVLLDGLSSGTLIALSRRHYVAADDRQAMVGAAWIRALAL
jgi:hypothetical protein